jgi:hypothetical protein
MVETHDFDRLEEAAAIIARHPDFPGKDEIVSRCVKEIDDYCREGRLSAEQRARLLVILAHPAHPALRPLRSQVE